MVAFRLKFVTTIIAFLFLFPSSAFAKPDPIQLSLVNVSKKGGNKGYKTVYRYLKKNSSIKLRSQKSVIKFAKKLGIKKSNLGSSKWRNKNKKKMAKLVQMSKVEALILLDIYKGGKKIQLASIGPEGGTVDNNVKKIKRGRISKSKARAMLKTSFKALVPEVLAFREGANDDEGVDEDDDANADDDEDSDDADADVEDGDDDNADDGDTDQEEGGEEKDSDKDASDYPYLAGGYKINLGVVLGKREFTLETTSGNDFTLKHESPYIGGGASLEAVFINMGSTAIGATLFGAFAPFTTLFKDPSNQDVFEFSSRYSQLGLDFNFLIGFSKELTIILSAGAEATSITIDPNQFYTGSRYIGGRGGLGVGYSIGPILLRANLIVVAIFNTNTADGAFGEADGLGIGFAPNLGLSFNLTDEISAGLNYNFRLLPATLTKGPVIENANSESSDIIHNGFISIGYSL